MLRNTKVFVSPGTTSFFFKGNLLVLSFKSLEDFSVELKEVRVVDLFWNNTYSIFTYPWIGSISLTI